MIRVNGVSRNFTGSTVSTLLDELAIEKRGIAVAVDGEVVSRSTWDATVVSDGSNVEIVTAAAGG